MDAQGYPESSLGVVSGGSWGSPGTLLSSPGLLWATFWTSRGGNMERLGVMFLSPGDAEGETSEKLESADPWSSVIDPFNGGRFTFPPTPLPPWTPADFRRLL